MEGFIAVLAALPLTLIVTAGAFGIGMIGGIPLMLGLQSRIGVVRGAARLLVDIIRGIPTIVWLFLLYFGVSFGGMRLESLPAAVIGLGVISSAYLAEIYRGSFQIVPRGQSEAPARWALGIRSRSPGSWHLRHSELRCRPWPPSSWR